MPQIIRKRIPYVGNIYDSQPVGEIIQCERETPPTGYIELGETRKSVLRSKYPELFKQIGTTYGAEDDEHFNLPSVSDNMFTIKGEVGVPQVAHFNASPSSGSYELVRFAFKSAFRCIISGTCGNYSEVKMIDVIASNASSPQSNTLGNTIIGLQQGSFSFGGGDWKQSSLYWDKPNTEDYVYYTVVFIPYSENNVGLVI